jgi:hypothetical protein
MESTSYACRSVGSLRYEPTGPTTVKKLDNDALSRDPSCFEPSFEVIVKPVTLSAAFAVFQSQEKAQADEFFIPMKYDFALLVPARALASAGSWIVMGSS